MYEINEGNAPSAIGEELEISDIFYTNNKRRNIFQVKLNSKGICLRRDCSAGTKVRSVNIGDIVGVRCMRSEQYSRNVVRSSCTCTSSPTSLGQESSARCEEEPHTDSSAYLYVFAYVLKKNLRSTVRRERTVLTLRFRSFDRFSDNIREADKWCRLLKWHKLSQLPRSAISARFQESRRLLVLLNPKSGCGRAREIFLKQVVPVFNEAEVCYDLFVTKCANFARDFVRMKSISSWAGIVAVGGDGLFFEILNGMLQRSDWEGVLPKIPIGILPSGSGNGLARSIAHLYKEPYDPKPILGATLTVLSGHCAPMDVVRVLLKNEVLFSFLSVGWGLISDIDIESERLRSIGYSRFTLWSLHRLVSLRTYRGKLSYLPKTDIPINNDDEGFGRKEILSHSASCNACLNRPDYLQSSEYINHKEFEDVISLETSVNHSFRSRCDSWYSAGSRKSTFYSIPESIYHSIADDSISGDGDIEASQPNLYSGPALGEPLLSDPIPDTWIIEEGDFIMVHAAYQTHLGTDCFFAPQSKLNDGIIYLVIIRGGTSRAQLFNFLVNMSSGTHLPTSNNAYIKVVPVTAFRIEPYDIDGIITVDGERMKFGSLQGEILPGIARVMVPR